MSIERYFYAPRTPAPPNPHPRYETDCRLLGVSDDSLEQWLVTALAQQGLLVDAKEQHSAMAPASPVVVMIFLT